MWKLLCCVAVVLGLIFLGQFNANVAGAAPGEADKTAAPEDTSAEEIPTPQETPEEEIVLPIPGASGLPMLRAYLLRWLNTKEGETKLIISEAPEMVIVPIAVDKVQGLAIEDISKAGLIPLTKPVFRPGYIPGEVVRQDPVPGTEVEPNSEVTLEVAQTEIAIQPAVELMEGTNQEEVWGQLIVHRPFDVELTPKIQNVPIFAIRYGGRDHVTGKELSPNFAEARAKAVAERLSIAWALLDQGAYLDVSAEEWIQMDDVSTWRLAEPFKPNYGNTPKPCPAIYLRHENLGVNPLRIITVYPNDALSFGPPHDETGTFQEELTERELAEYLVALIKAHHLLFHKRSVNVADYEKLEICKTREGNIFKEICIRAREAAEGESLEAVRDALARVAMSQRTRLTTLAYKAPKDWRTRNR